MCSHKSSPAVRTAVVPRAPFAHAVQALTEQHPDAAILSIDGVGAFDLISRESMLRGLMRCPGREFGHAFRADVLWPTKRVLVAG